MTTENRFYEIVFTTESNWDIASHGKISSDNKFSNCH
jgi:hypothetical protein